MKQVRALGGSCKGEVEQQDGEKIPERKLFRQSGGEEPCYAGGKRQRRQEPGQIIRRKSEAWEK